MIISSSICSRFYVLGSILLFLLTMLRLVPATVETSFINTFMILSSRENIPEQLDLCNFLHFLEIKLNQPLLNIIPELYCLF